MASQRKKPERKPIPESQLEQILAHYNTHDGKRYYVIWKKGNLRPSFEPHSVVPKGFVMRNYWLEQSELGKIRDKVNEADILMRSFEGLDENDEDDVTVLNAQPPPPPTNTIVPQPTVALSPPVASSSSSLPILRMGSSTPTPPKTPEPRESPPALPPKKNLASKRERKRIHPPSDTENEASSDESVRGPRKKDKRSSSNSDDEGKYNTGSLSQLAAAEEDTCSDEKENWDEDEINRKSRKTSDATAQRDKFKERKKAKKVKKSINDIPELMEECFGPQDEYDDRNGYVPCIMCPGTHYHVRYLPVHFKDVHRKIPTGSLCQICGQSAAIMKQEGGLKSHVKVCTLKHLRNKEDIPANERAKVGRPSLHR